MRPSSSRARMGGSPLACGFPMSCREHPLATSWEPVSTRGQQSRRSVPRGLSASSKDGIITGPCGRPNADSGPTPCDPSNSHVESEQCRPVLLSAGR